MSAVPDSLDRPRYGMNATNFEVTTGVVVPAAASGIVSSSFSLCRGLSARR